jgi:integrase/recombinase XerD
VSHFLSNENMGLHIRVVLDTRKIAKKATEETGIEHFPVRLRVTYDRKRRYFKTDLPPLSTKDWEKIEKGVRMSTLQRELFHGIRDIEARAHSIAEDLHPFSFPVFKTRFFSGANITSNTLLGMFNAHIDRLEKEERLSTASSYHYALQSLLKYRKTLNWNDLHPEFFEGYESYMRKRGKSQNTIGMYLRSLRTIVNQGRAQGIIDQSTYPFGKTSQGKYQIPSSVNTKRALSSDEIQKIKDATPAVGSRAERARDFWLFSYYINGCNIKDIAYLTWSEIDFEENMVRFVRKKTQRANKGRLVKVSAVLSPIAKEVIEKYSKPSNSSNDFVFSIISKSDTAKQKHNKLQDFTKHINIGLKQLAELLGIEKNITTYTARHSHATALINSGASLEFIMDQFKHASMQTTMNYVDSIDDSKRKDMAKLL